MDEEFDRYDEDGTCRCAHCGAEVAEDLAVDCPVCDEALCRDCLAEGRGCEAEQGESNG